MDEGIAVSRLSALTTDRPGGISNWNSKLTTYESVRDGKRRRQRRKRSRSSMIKFRDGKRR